VNSEVVHSPRKNSVWLAVEQELVFINCEHGGFLASWRIITPKQEFNDQSSFYHLPPNTFMKIQHNDLLDHMHSAAIAWDRIHPNHIGDMALAKAFLQTIDFDWIRIK